MRPITFAISLVLGLLLAGPATAWVLIDVTSSEVLSVDPPRVRTTFVLSVAGYQPGPFQFFSVFPSGAEPQPVLFDCAAPPAWTCGDDFPPEYGGQFFGWTENSGAPPFTFSIVSDRASPCVRFRFDDPVLARTTKPALNSTYEIEACLVVNAPTPTTTRSWGHLKSTYR